MKLAISNIAWEPTDNEAIVELLRRYNVEGIELAPTKHWIYPDQATETEIDGYRVYWLKRGLTPAAMQSLLFNRPHFSIFGDQKQATMVYLMSLIHMAGRLSVRALVFGSPKNRLIGSLDYAARYEEAIDFFRQLGESAVSQGVNVCIEANPRAYGCDFITTTLEGLKFIKDVDSEGIRLHLDTGTMLLNEEPVHTVISECLPYAGHFHISDPFLLIPGAQQYSHHHIADAVVSSGYTGWLSLEMKAGNSQDNQHAVLQALEYINRVYLKK